MKFYNLNIKHFKDPMKPDGAREGHASFWLDSAEARAPIFFGRTTVDQIVNTGSDLTGRSIPGARLFCEVGQHHDEWSRSLIVTVDEGRVWIYQPSGFIEERNEPKYPNDLTKSFKVTLLSKPGLSLRDVPLVLSGMKSNQAFCRNTFQEIDPTKYRGNVLSIVAMLSEGKQRAQLLKEIGPADRIDCLSSVEFETLVAKLLESAGCFVPAYKGGFIRDIDLLVHNDGDGEVDLDGLIVPGKSCRTIQVKLRTDHPGSDKGHADYLITGSNVALDGCFGREWLSLRLARSLTVQQWLERSTRWIPSSAVR